MAECSSEDYLLAQESGGHFRCLTRGQAIGSAIRVETGLISLLALIVVFVLIVRNTYRCWRKSPPKGWSLFAAPADIYVFSVFVFDTIQCVGRTLDIRWVREGKVYTGSYCTAAGAIQQVGETGSAQITLAMAIHTFITLWARKGTRARWFAAGIVLLICLYNSLFVGISVALNKGEHPYDSPSKYWCWISSDLPNSRALRITGQYVWIWIALVMCYVVYVPLFFWARGNITIDDHRPWRFSFHHRQPDTLRVRSLGILALPVVYAITALPTSIGRWYGFQHETGPNQMPSAASFAVSSIYGLTGLFNVLLLFARPDVLLFDSTDNKHVPNHHYGAHATLPSASTPEQGSKAEITSVRSPSAQHPTTYALPQTSRPVTGTSGVGALPAADDSDDDDDDNYSIQEMRQRPRGASDATNWGEPTYNPYGNAV